MRLIDADYMRKLVDMHGTNKYGMLDENIRVFIEQQPTIEERKTGRWEITHAYPHNVYCSECHKKFAQTHWAVWKDGSLPRNFCPNCGAKMEIWDEIN